MLFWRRSHEVRDEDVSAYVDGELDVAARRRVEVHLESCPPCRGTVAELRAVGRALSELPHVRAPRSFALRRDDLETAPARLRLPGSLFGTTQPLLSGLAAIALVAFVVLAGVDITTSRTSDSFENAVRTAGQEGSVQGVPEAAELAPEPHEAVTDDEGGTGDTLSGGLESADDGSSENDEPQIPGIERIVPASGAEAIPDALVGREDDNSTGLRAGEAAAAAVALVAGSSAAVIWWRRRRSEPV